MRGGNSRCAPRFEQVEEPCLDGAERHSAVGEGRGQSAQYPPLVAGPDADGSFAPERLDQTGGERRARIVLTLVQIVRIGGRRLRGSPSVCTENRKGIAS